MKSSEVLKAALERMDGGRKWMQGASHRAERCCSSAALSDMQVQAGGWPHKAFHFLEMAIHKENVMDWNDHASDFSVIEKGFQAAISLAIAEGD